MNLMDTLKKPLVIAVLALFLGIALGITYGYAIDPVKWVNQPMTWTRDDLKKDYMSMAIHSFRVDRKVDDATRRYNDLGAEAPAYFALIEADPAAFGVAPGEVKLFREQVVAPMGNNGIPTEPPASGGDGGGNVIVTALIIVGSFIVLGLVGVALFWLFRTSRRSPEDMTPAQIAAEHSRSVEKTDYSAVSSTPPVAQYITTYVIGDDLFDDSFSIDAPSGEFLGECGVGISETVGTGDPKKVTAFEVWMFDKNDIQTITKVLMSASAFSDMALRAKLEPKGELVQIDPRKQVLLETQTLQMIATISDMQYGQGALPNGSYFERLTMELAIWQKAK